MWLSSLKPEYLKRYKDLLRLLLKYGRADVLRRIRAEEIYLEPEKTEEPQISRARELPADLERLGPTYIKLGQFLSTRSDMLPAAYTDALQHLLDRVEQIPYTDVEEIIHTELKVRISRAFFEFEKRPIAAASLAQVHRAVLHDGRMVAVKVQRPGVRERIVKDLEAFKVIAGLLDRYTAAGRQYQFSATLRQFRRTTLRELNFRQEAQNLVLIGENLKAFDRIIVPTPIEDYTTPRVLTMDYIRGLRITSLSPLVRLEIDGPELAEQLFKAYLQQILVDGFYHADPHPGNIFLTDTGSLALIDLGMVGRVSESMQRGLLHLLMAISEGRGDESVQRAIEIGEKTPDFDERRFRERIVDLVGQYQHSTVQEIEVGRVVLEVFRAAGEFGVRFPGELSMLGKTLLSLDQVGRTLAPEFSPNLSIRNNAAELFRRSVGRSLSSGKAYDTAMDAFEFLEMLPKRMNRLMGSLANNSFKINLNAIDEQYMMTGLQKIANRLTAGMILAAMILAGSLLIQVKTSLTIFEYPAIAVIFLLLAAGGGLILLLEVFLQDERMKKKRKSPRI